MTCRRFPVDRVAKFVLVPGKTAKEKIYVLSKVVSDTPPAGNSTGRTNTRKRTIVSSPGDMSSSSDTDCMSVDNVTPLKKNSRQRKKPKNESQSRTRKLNVQHKDIPNNVQFTVPTSNKFSALSDADDEVRFTKKSVAIKKVRIPPIIVPPLATRITIKAALGRLGIADYFIKHASVGIYVHVNTLEHHKKIRELFKNDGIYFFSHDLPEDKMVKVVLRGLDKMVTSKLTNELKSLGFEPNDVKVIVPKQSRYTDHANYIIYFKRDSVDLKALYNVKAIFHTIIRWEPYRSSRSSPTQCRRCQRPGHGTRHCGMPPRCMYCAKDHQSDECPCIKAAYDEAKTISGQETPSTLTAPPTLSLVCCNCDGAHAASDPQCPAKLKYQQIQRGLSSRNRRPPPREFVRREEDFPYSLPTASLPAATSTSRRPLYSQVAATVSPKTTARKIISPMNPSSNDGSDDLFSVEEITSLVQEMLSSLSKCRNKSDQFQVISNLAIKYVYNGRK